MKSTAIILAGGSGSRMQSDIKKQYLELCGHEVIWYSLRAFQESSVDKIILVCSADDVVRNDKYLREFDKLIAIITGGSERYDSVWNGLQAILSCDYVLIHDGARPLISVDIIEHCIRTLDTEHGCVVAVPSKDTVRIVDEDGYAVSTPDRRTVWNVQTPQGFHYDDIFVAFDNMMRSVKDGDRIGEGLNITDDAMVAELFGDMRIKMVEGDHNNIKLTTQEDLIVAEKLLIRQGTTF